MKIAFEIPLKLVSGANAREHWGSRQHRAKQQRTHGAIAAANAILRLPRRLKFPVVVRITRRGKRPLDSDNLAISGKHLRDGIADAIGVNDGDEAKVTWEYQQEHSPKYSARVEIEEVEACSPQS